MSGRRCDSSWADSKDEGASKYDDKEGEERDAKRAPGKIDVRLPVREDELKPSGDEDIVKKVARYFFEDESFANSFEEWVQHRCHEIDLESDEYKLKYTELHNAFKRLFEEKLEAFIEHNGSTVLEFYDKIREKMKEDAWSDESIFAQILLATTDFDIFFQMMKEAALKRREAK